MFPPLRQPAVMAVVLLASLLLLLLPNPATEPMAPRTGAVRIAANGAVAPPAAPDTPPTVPTPQGESFGFPQIQELAKQRAAHAYRPMPDNLPEALAKISYDQYQNIRFRPESALWRGQSLFEVQFFHRGFTNKQRVNIFEVTAEGVSPIAYHPQYFTFERLPPRLSRIGHNLGYAGFRVHFPLEHPADKDELIAFLGASYFRFLGRNQHYGQSARGLAIDTAAQSGEEFPVFTDFWLVRPHPTDRTLTVYALLDSKSAAGAYQFQIRPGDMTQVEVHSELYPRRGIAKPGIAPLTSMYLYGEENSARRFDDYRPQVHDTDGLMMETGHGEWIWRPLANPRELRVNRFIDENPRGFGLIQRQRDFAHYQDAGARYDLRPSYWVQPLGNWGKGGVELVEIPSDSEINDNIVAYWVPERAVTAGQSLSFAYLLTAYANAPTWPPGGRAIATRSGNPAMGDNKGNFGEGARRMLVDFAGGALESLDGALPVKAHVTADNGRVEEVGAQRIEPTGAWRAVFVVAPTSKKPVDLRCYLTLYGEGLTETWVYQWVP